VKVTWDIYNHEADAATFEVTAHGPDGSVIDHETGTLAGGQTTKGAVVQTKVKVDTEATITVHVVWAKGKHVLDQKTIKGTADRKSCASPSPSTPEATTPAPSPSRSGGTGGGGGTPTPSSSTTPPSLPLTGPNATIYGGGAALLLAAGGTLFVVARRRRIRFEA
jgi:LPXTG-motif cell wall-anchored protein